MPTETPESPPLTTSDVTGYTQDGDLSAGIIQQLMGSGFEALLNNTADTAAIESSTLLGEMFGIVNAFAMLAAGLVIIYVYAVGVMETAHTGESLGKRYSTLWTPIRTSLGVMLVAPFPGLGGFSILQGIIIGCVSLSIGGGNMLWQKQLEYFSNHGTVFPVTTAGLPEPATVEAALTSMVCQLHQTKAYNDQEREINNAGIFTQAYTYMTGISQPVTYSFPGPQAPYEKIRTHSYGYRWGPACGEITIECGMSSNNAGNMEVESAVQICQAKGEATKAMIAELAPVAVSIYNGTAALPESGTLSAVGNAASAYLTTYSSHMSALEAQLETDRTTSLNEFQEQGSMAGWMSAGAWHWLMAKVSLAANNAALQSPNIVAIDPDDITNYEEEFLPLHASVKEYTQLAPKLSWTKDAEGNTVVAERTGGSSDAQGNAEALLNKVIGPKFEQFSVIISDSRDPIATLSHYGNSMMNGAVGIAFGMMAVNATVTSVKDAGDAVPVIGGLLSAPGKAIAGMWEVLLTFLQFLVLPLWLAGGFLAYYLPLVPFIFWTFGVLGWLIMVAESLVAAPIWAVSHVVPEGEGFAGNHARQGWLLLLNILFRPILLVIGLFLSMIMMYFISKLALEGFSIYSGSVMMTTGWGLSSFFAFIFLNIIFIGLLISLSHKAHEMIYETADNVMRWVGSNVKPLGEAQGEQATHRTYGAAAAHVGQGGSAVMGKGKQPGESKAPTAKREIAGDTGNAGGGRTSPDALNGGSESKGREGKDSGNKM